MSPALVVGCPIRGRTWSLDSWFAHIEDACGHAAIEPAYAFAVDPADETFAALGRWANEAEIHLAMLDEEAPVEAEAMRRWDQRDRLEHMVDVRNHLLGVVRDLNPTYFWSVDSDIMVAPAALASALDFLEEGGYSAVASLTWMHPVGFEWPNHGIYDPAHGGLRRFPTEPGAQHETGIIMAVKLMDYWAYNIDYVYHKDGEDIGWSLACREAGLSLGVDGAHPCKHVMSPELLERPDVRLGW